MFFDRMVEKWADLPELKTTVENPDIIAPLGYGMLIGNCLPWATIANFERSLLAIKYFPKALIIFGNSAHCFKGSEVVEGAFKHQWLIEKGVSKDKFWNVGPITNTVTEAERIKHMLNTRGIMPAEIILITGQMHAPYAVLVWHQTFPKAKIALCVTPYFNEYQPEHLIILQRNRYLLFAVRVVQYEVARYISLDFFRKIKHPVFKSKTA